MNTVGIIGCGSIGSQVAIAVEEIITECDRLILYDVDYQRADKLKDSLHIKTKVVRNIEDMIKSEPRAIIEAASQQAVRDYLRKIVSCKIDFIVLSTGALLDNDFRSKKVHLAPGAIGGLDVISSVALAGLKRAILITRKNPRILKMSNKEQKLVYKGDAEKAARLFPKEMNVAATLAIAIRPAKAEVRIISDPKTDRIVHELRVYWKYGKMRMQFANETYPEKPQTSVLATYSVVSILKNLLE